LQFEMPMLLALLLSSCGPSTGPLPVLVLPADTLVLREHIVGPGSERTGSWWARFDGQGCYTEAHNTWLWVTDPFLRRQHDGHLHWNTVTPSEPWFCLTPRQRARLLAAARQVPWEAGVDGADGPVDRWTVNVDGEPRTVVVPTRSAPGSAAPLVVTLEALAGEGVWGQSPEPDIDFGIASLRP